MPKAKKLLRHAIADALVDWGVPLGAWFIPVLIGIGAFTLTDEATQFLAKHLAWTETGWRYFGWTCLGIGALLYFPSAIASIRRKKRVTQLEARERDLKEALDGVSSDALKVFDQHLLRVAEALALNRPGATDRITLYANGGTGYFTALARYSPDPVLRRKTSKIYHEEQGCIGKAWRKGEHFDNEYPDSRNEEGWLKRAKRDGLPWDVASKIRMKSRLYYGYRIDSRSQESLAVVILESTEPNRYLPSDLREFFDHKGKELLQPPLEQFASSLPQATVAREAGF